MRIHLLTRTGRGVLAAATAASLAACSADKIQTPIEVNVTPEGAGANPTAALQLLATGIVAADRGNHGGYVRDLALFGREAFYFQLQDGRWITHYFRDYNDYTSFAVGNWAGRFTNLRNLDNLATAVKAASTLSAAQVAATNGFIGTERALQVLYLVNTRHDLGTPVSVASDPSVVTPFVSRDSAFKFIVGNLDAGYAALQQGGAAFPFTLPQASGSGYAGFSTPADYAKFNRAIKARVEAYRASLGCGASCYQSAKTALAQSFISATLSAANLNTGVYHLYSSASGDATNTLWGLRTDLYANMAITTDPTVPQSDARLAAKLTTATSRSQAGSEASTRSFTVYPQNSSPIPVIDNEELWLLKAEIEWYAGDKTAAVAALNAVAQAAGGATGNRYTGITTDAQFLDALLAERRLSLMLEGHRWIDMRRFNRLAQLPAGGTGFTVAKQQVVPQLECQTRDRTGDASLKGPGCP
jgi:starch-binding outer membrane protein, SusD/RagB family